MNSGHTQLDALFERAEALLVRGEQAQALQALSAIVSVDPSHRRALVALAASLVGMGRQQDAMALYAHYLVGHPEDEEIYKDYRRLYDATGIRLVNTAAQIAESAHAHHWLDGLRGLEIGPSSLNPFGVEARHVGMRDEIYEREQLIKAGVIAQLDIFATADALPLPDESEQFVLTSHVIEHCPDLIKTLLEWYRVIALDGLIYMIVPLRDAAPSDRDRPLTLWDHVLDDYRRGATAQSEAGFGQFGHCHYHVFDLETMQQFVAQTFQDRLMLVDALPRDDKVGNGFTLVYRKVRALAQCLPWQIGHASQQLILDLKAGAGGRSQIARAIG